MSAGDVPRFRVEAESCGPGYRLRVAFGSAAAKTYRIVGTDQQHFADFFLALSRDHGTRVPHAFGNPAEAPADSGHWQPLLTENVAPDILCGYGDPAVLRTDEGYVLVATSNDAPDAFPILRSDDLLHWRYCGSVFPRGSEPGWAATGPGIADFWAPEMVRAGGRYWLAYAARQKDNVLAIGLARSDRPEGPWTDLGRPLVTGPWVETSMGRIQCGVIDPHLFVDHDGATYLLWKDDSNGLWPRPLAMLLQDDPRLIQEFFADASSRKSAAFAAAIVDWANGLRPMERFFLMQPLIEAALDNWTRVRAALERSGLASAILEAMTTPVHAQQLDLETAALAGEPTVVLRNDLDWEGHLIEGPFVTRHEGRYWLFYAGNDFSTPAYGIGVAVADHLLGPYVKQLQPLLRSARQWSAPGHASVAHGLDGEPRLFFHAFHPGTSGYNAFRALLTAPLRFSGDRVEIADATGC